ncbi:MAG: EamA-like transporter family protein [Sporomusa sp.]|jgi:transporter family protein|nr:EamA-like transporter family protein [Sporomusa sp.]
MIFLYAFLAVLCLGLAPLFGKSALYTINPITTLVIRTFIATALVSIWLITTRTYIGFTTLSLSSWLLIGMEAILAAVLGELAYFYALQKGDVYEIAVLMSCAPLVTIFLGSLFWSQPLSLRHIIGAFIVTIGLVVLCGE